jgi:hypothetical protein
MTDIPELDRKLLKWGYRTDPTHPVVQQEVLDKAVSRELQTVGAR